MKKTHYNKDDHGVDESLFMVGNGYLGQRGTFEEGVADGTPSKRGLFINGLYEKVPMHHAEMAYGFPTDKDRMPKLADIDAMHIFLDGERVLFSPEKCSDYTRELDMRAGLTTRSYRYQAASGKMATLTFKRLASFTHKHHLAFALSVDYDGDITVHSFVEHHLPQKSETFDPRLAEDNIPLTELDDVRIDDNRIELRMHTIKTQFTVFIAVQHQVTSQAPCVKKPTPTGITFTANGRLAIEKIAYIADSKHAGDGFDTPQNLSLSFAELAATQHDYLANFWQRAGIVIEGNDADQEAIAFAQYQLLQSITQDSFGNIAAKGLSGDGYEGHFFWDTEIYILPAMMIHSPDIAKQLLGFRYQTLAVAKNYARKLNYAKGALYPWRTISGHECSGFFPAGTAQYHINADIAYAFIQYHKLTGDIDFLVEQGFEVIVETARLWLEIGHYHNQAFHIYGVTGPDEYTAIVNDNYYTNAMVKHHLAQLVKLYREHQDTLAPVAQRLGLDDAELQAFENASDSMHFAYDNAQQLVAQDASFLSKPKLYKNLKHPLLLHDHPLNIYRYQVLKQADVLLAHFLLPDNWDIAQIQRDYHYYEPLTTHDSSLSKCIYGLVACRFGNTELAYENFKEASQIDLQNLHGNTQDGLHMASLAGAILSVIYGFAGLKFDDNDFTASPTLPSAWQKLTLPFAYQGKRYHLTVSHDAHNITEATL